MARAKIVHCKPVSPILVTITAFYRASAAAPAFVITPFHHNVHLV
jgi:hypothetical protein